MSESRTEYYLGDKKKAFLWQFRRPKTPPVPVMWNHFGLNSIRNLHLAAVHFLVSLNLSEYQCSKLKNGNASNHKIQPMLFDEFSICYALGP